MSRKEINVKTPAGTIIARQVTSKDAPGIDIVFQPKGSEDEVGMAYVEYKANPDFRVGKEIGREVLMFIYGDAESDEYTAKYMYTDTGRSEQVE